MEYEMESKYLITEPIALIPLFDYTWMEPNGCYCQQVYRCKKPRQLFCIQDVNHTTQHM